MSETESAVATCCPRCGGAVEASARFCKHCASPLTGPGHLPVQAPHRGVKQGNRNVGYLILAAGAVVVIAAAGFGIFMFKGRSAQTATATVTAAPTALMSDKATRIEEKILRGESLLESDTDDLSAYELRVLRNVHFARYGRQYDRPGLGDYFATRSWYKPSDDYKDSMVTAIDKGNINLILAAESKAGNTSPTNATTQSVPVTAAIQPTPSASPSGAGSTHQLSHDEMQSMIVRRGAWDYGFGWIRVSEVEILRVGEFNEQQKYWPVRARVSIINRGSLVLDYQIYKNDYGDWTVRMVGSI